MKISGFTYIRNGHTLDYPFIESIKSALPICDEMIVVVGDSNDGSRESIERIGSEKIKIIDSVWDDNLKHGLVFREQANIGLDNISGDWGLHIQADEILHEKELEQIVESINRNDGDSRIEGLLFPYLHFWGYNHIVKGRRARRYEIRLVRNNRRIRSYRDSQGFRIYPDQEAYLNGHVGEKLKVALIKPHIYHYSRVRPPALEMKKIHKLGSHLGGPNRKNIPSEPEWDYSNIDWIEEFPLANHPHVMLERVKSSTWKLEYKKGQFHLKNWLSNTFEAMTGHRIGEYTNWNIIKRP